MTKIGWIGYVMSAAIAVIGITVQTMMQSRKIGKREKIFSKEDQRTGFDGIGSRKGQNAVSMMEMLEESLAAAEDKEKTDNAEETDQDETVTGIFDQDDTKPDEDDLDDDEDIVTVETMDKPRAGFLDDR